MLPNFPYLAMTITGVFHLVFGFIIFIASVVGFNHKLDLSDYYVNGIRQWELDNINRALNIYLGVVLTSSFWIMMVGILGILAGVKSREHNKTHHFKIAYMVTAILSAVIFSLAGISLGILVNQELFAVGLVGGLCSFADFVMAIVSSSICCCCATSSTPNVVVVQSQGTPIGYPPPYAGNVQTYLPQSPDQGFTNPGYQPTGQGYPQPAPAVGYTVKSDIA